jgi:hypothetical protein
MPTTSGGKPSLYRFLKDGSLRYKEGGRPEWSTKVEEPPYLLKGYVDTIGECGNAGWE